MTGLVSSSRACHRRLNEPIRDNNMLINERKPRGPWGQLLFLTSDACDVWNVLLPTDCTADTLSREMLAFFFFSRTLLFHLDFSFLTWEDWFALSEESQLQQNQSDLAITSAVQSDLAIPSTSSLT